MWHPDASGPSAVQINLVAAGGGRATCYETVSKSLREEEAKKNSH